MQAQAMSYQRFIIPITFQKDQYNKICTSYITSDWRINQWDQEHELYEFAYKLFDSSYTESIGIGLYTNLENHQLINGNFDKPLNLSRLELVLFKTGLAFLTYQVEYGPDATLEEVLARNNQLKSIEHNNERVHVTQALEMPLEDTMLDANGIAIPYYDKGKSEVRLAGEVVAQFNESMPLKAYSKNKSMHLSGYQTKTYDLRVFINKVLGKIVPKSFFIREFIYDQNQTMISKANVFSMLQIQNMSEDDAEVNVLRMARGYTKSYLIRKEENANSVYRPFDNVYWSAAREGVGNIIIYDSSVQTHFWDSHYLKRMDNYAFLYMFALQQYYHLIHIGNQIGKLSGHIDDYLITDDQYKVLKDIYETVDYIYLKCIYREITHISHQARIYAHFLDVLSIDALLHEVSSEIQRLKSSVEEVRRRKVIQDSDAQRHLSEVRSKYFTILGGVFAFFSIVDVLWNISIKLQVETWFLRTLLPIIIWRHLAFVALVLFLGITVGSGVYKVWRSRKRYHD